ncbi:iron-sensing transcription factor Fep1 [Tubulinosema ratisbonensis]|uniref:Iron-sensing transcription factor Fep1 n=1 Tax=Tubulinosema ratisbonensis TaxID=291195 RepID=A0A437AMB4_9MICR|nr:iron-sensing transcription factor Fep1 [Tubulinosema ratisbonensis]
MRKEYTNCSDNDFVDNNRYCNDRTMQTFTDESFGNLGSNFDSDRFIMKNNFYNQRIDPIYSEPDQFFSRNLRVSGFKNQKNGLREFEYYNNIPELNNQLYQPHINYYNEDYFLWKNYSNHEIYSSFFTNTPYHSEKRVGRRGNKRKNRENMFCEHCMAKETPLWRHLGNLNVCNACWLYYKAHGVKRPFDPEKKILIRRGRSKKKQKL